MLRARLFMLLALLITVSALAPSPTFAATGGIISFDQINGSLNTCELTLYSFYTAYVPSHDDGDGYDYITYAIYDAHGNLILQSPHRKAVNNVLSSNFINLMGSSPNYLITTLTRPITITMIDLPVALTNDQMGETNRADVIDLMHTQGTVIASLTFDIATVNPDCLNWTLYEVPLTAANCPVLPSGSVVGSLPGATRAYYSPGNLSTVTLNAGTYWVIGMDESGAYYRIMLACQFLWVPVESMQPNWEAPWNGQPLPTRVVG